MKLANALLVLIVIATFCGAPSADAAERRKRIRLKTPDCPSEFQHLVEQLRRHSESPAPAPVSAHAVQPIDGVTVTEWNAVPVSKDIVAVTPEELISFYGSPDMSKVVKTAESPPVPPGLAQKVKDSWHQSIIDLGEGRKMLVIYQIIGKNRVNGKFVIRFEDPLHRGEIKTVEMAPGELRQGYKGLDIAPPTSRNQGL